jgi:asparagine synthase (glutamine-hydrolysing)
MCGLAGIFCFEQTSSVPGKPLLQKMISTLRHRGPDSCGFYRDRQVGLAHARLSIIDLVGGDQPMANEDRTLWIVFNGEIYNYIELRNDLQRCGHRFRTSSDTEVILHAFEEWGTDSFLRFNGQWAFALWDSKSKRLCLCRDRVGVRPLFVTQQGHRLLFASEIKALFADHSVVRKIDPRGLAQVFTHWCPTAPTTVFEGVEELRPGSYRTYGVNGLLVEGQYWIPPFPARESSTQPGSMGRAAEELKSRMMDAVRLRMTRADVPVGCYLSGGIDSSVISYFAREFVSGEFRTFSLRFADQEFDESKFQQMLVERIGSKHSSVTVTRQDIAEAFPSVIYHTEQPVLRTAPAPLFLLSRLVRNCGFKTVLTGEGSDEFLAGYDIFREAKIRAFWARRPDSQIRPRLFERVYPYLKRSPQQARAMATAYWKIGLNRPDNPWFSHERRWTTTATLHRFFLRDLREAVKSNVQEANSLPLPEGFGSWDELHRAQFLEIGTLFSGYILSAQGDRMLMSHSVEGRFPFLDDRVMEYSCMLDPIYTLPGLKEKAVLKKLAKDLIPEEILNRPKQPYRAPDAVCFVGRDAPEWVNESLSEDAIAEVGLFDTAAVSALVRKLRDTIDRDGEQAIPSNIDNMALTGIISSQLLHEQLIKHSLTDDSRHSTSWKVAVDERDSVRQEDAP